MLSFLKGAKRANRFYLVTSADSVTHEAVYLIDPRNAPECFSDCKATATKFFDRAVAEDYIRELKERDEYFAAIKLEVTEHYAN